MSTLHIPPALDRHLVSAAHSAATAGDFALGAFDAVVEQIVLALRDQGAGGAAIERAFSDVFAGLAFPHARTPAAARYAALEGRALTALRRPAPARRSSQSQPTDAS